MNSKNNVTSKKSSSISDESKTSSLSRTRILVVDDEPLICQLCAELLSDSGYEVETAENGAVAWNALQQNGYDLLITDNDMPQVSGVELLKKVKAARMTLPVIMVSGTLPTEKLEQHPGLRLDGALLKPFDIMEFIGVVKKVLHAADSVASSAKLFRDCALKDSKVPARAEKPANASIQAQTNSSHRILVVDDDNEVRQLNVKMLADSGYEAEGVQDGAVGWQALQTCDYDLVITDNKMPRMTGVEMIAKLRSARMAVPVIMATAKMPTHEFERRPWIKPDIALEKPFSNDDLLAAVKNTLHADG